MFVVALNLSTFLVSLEFKVEVTLASFFTDRFEVLIKTNDDVINITR
jgi:hypothetical protein